MPTELEQLTARWQALKDAPGKMEVVIAQTQLLRWMTDHKEFVDGLIASYGDFASLAEEEEAYYADEPAPADRGSGSSSGSSGDS